MQNHLPQLWKQNGLFGFILVFRQGINKAKKRHCKHMVSAQTIAVIFLVVLFAGAFWIYPHLPARIAVHWNALGEADGFASKEAGVAILPLITFFVGIILFVIPKLDGMKTIMKSFQREYELFALTFMLFMGYLFMLTTLWNLGYQFEFVAALVPGIVVLFFVLSHLLEKTEPNPFVGIRLPSTMKNPKIWKQVHKRAGKKLRTGTFVMAIGIIFPDYAVLFILLPLLYFVADSILHAQKLQAQMN